MSIEAAAHIHFIHLGRPCPSLSIAITQTKIVEAEADCYKEETHKRAEICS